MTTFSESREAIYKTFNNAWNNPEALTLGNEQFTPEGDFWVRLTVQHRNSEQTSLGGETNRKFERSGVAFFQVFTSSNTGTNKADEIVELIQSLFEGKRIAGTTICFHNVRPRENESEGIWFNITVEAEFTYQEIK